MVNYTLGYHAMRLAGARYMRRMRDILDEVEKEGETDPDKLIACTYLKGIYDMAVLYLRVTDGVDMAACLREIDGRVDEMLSGG